MQEQRTQSLSRDLYQNIIFILLLLAASVEVLGELLLDTGQKSAHVVVIPSAVGKYPPSISLGMQAV